MVSPGSRTGAIRYLRPALMSLAVTVAVAALVIGFSIRYRHAIEQDRNVARAQLNDTRGRIQQIELSEHWLDEFGVRYQKLVGSGIVGPERRLDWAEQFNQGAGDIGLTSVDYALKPREEMALPMIDGSGFTVYQSAMDVTAELLHSLDLTRLLASLDRRGNALIMPESCQINRVRPFDRIEPRPSLEAQCRLWWVTIARRHTVNGVDHDG